MSTPPKSKNGDRARVDEIVREEIVRSKRRARYRKRREAEASKALEDLLADMEPREREKALRALAAFKVALGGAEE